MITLPALSGVLSEFELLITIKSLKCVRKPVTVTSKFSSLYLTPTSVATLVSFSTGVPSSLTVPGEAILNPL